MSEKRVLVTGSSRGIGRAIAARLAKDGWTVAVHGSQMSAELDSIAAEVGAEKAYMARLDGRPGADKLIDQVLADGPLHALVNNAGIYEQAEFTRSSDDEFERVFEQMFKVNFESPVWLARRACKHFLDRGAGGRVLNIASRVGHRGEANASAYSAAKAALINMTRALAVEHAMRKIAHFALAPGWVDTSMSRDGMEDRLPSILESIPLGRMATPEDCAGAASYLLSGEADYLSGVVLDINGASYLR